MQVLFDTSILISAFMASHPKHATAVHWLQRAIQGEIKLVIAAHTLAESYAVLTRIPSSPRISPSIALNLIEDNIIKIAQVVALSAEEYIKLIYELKSLKLSGSIIYDAIIFNVAKKAKVDKIVTLNYKDFIRFSSENESFIHSL